MTRVNPVSDLVPRPRRLGQFCRQAALLDVCNWSPIFASLFFGFERGVSFGKREIR